MSMCRKDCMSTTIHADEGGVHLQGGRPRRTPAFSGGALPGQAMPV